MNVNPQEAIANENIALSPFARSQVDGDIGHKMTWQRYHRLSGTYPNLAKSVQWFDFVVTLNF